MATIDQPLGKEKSLDPAMIPWVAIALLAAFTIFFSDAIAQLGSVSAWLAKSPKAFNKEIVGAINWATDGFIALFGWLFSAISRLLEWPMLALQSFLLWLPWSATVAGFAFLAYVAGGRWLALFTITALLYMVLTGYWDESMNTLALVGVSVPLAVALGFGLGVWGYRSDRAERIIQPCLDLMQTVPTFAYLIPILLLFGFGPVVGLIASAIYACPPMVRNTMHGLRRIPPDILESGSMSGTTPRQRFWLVEVPTALPQIMVGVNQATMAALSMVIIAAIIGGFDDIGWEVLSTMRKAQFGQSLLSGLVIALIAMIMDRISWGFTSRDRLLHATADQGLWQRHKFLISAIGVMILLTVLGHVIPALGDYPNDWRFYPADTINKGLSYLVSQHGVFFDEIKKAANFFFLLPIKIGFIKTIRPGFWGFEFTAALQSGYWVVSALITILLCWKVSWRLGVTFGVIATVLFYGLSAIPWPFFLASVCLIAWQAGGWRISLFAGLSMLFILLSGSWANAMLSVYLCGAAVAFSFVVGGLLGVWAARNDTFSRLIRPINDTLQTMPQFVYLIPVLFLFQIGDFSALIAVIAYCIVPMIRYTEHGIRGISPQVVEAARAMGCTKRQVLFQVQLPMALPEIMLGLNQTIMFGLAMLVIAALVGTRDLGQSVYIALGKADAGQGLVAGLSIALIAMVSDRIIQAWANKKKAQLGLT